MDEKLLGNRIKTRREELHMTAVDLAQEVRMDRATIFRYENGTVKRIKLPVIEAFARALKVNPVWLIGKSDDKYDLGNLSDQSKDFKDVENIVAFTNQLLHEEGLMFGGNPMTPDAIQSIIDAMEVGMAMAENKMKKNKEQDM